MPDQAPAVAKDKKKKARVNGLSKTVAILEAKIAQLENRLSTIVAINTFAPEPFELLTEIKVVVEVYGEEFTASFFDANLHAAGCTEVEAVDNLKDTILSRFQYLNRVPPKKLGLGLKKQQAVLRSQIRKRS